MRILLFLLLSCIVFGQATFPVAFQRSSGTHTAFSPLSMDDGLGAYYIVGGTPVEAYRVISYVAGSKTVVPHVGTGTYLGISITAGSPGQQIFAVGYGSTVCEFDATPVPYNVATADGDKCHDSGTTQLSSISTTIGAFGRTLIARPDLCVNCAEVIILQPANVGRKLQMADLPSGLITLVVSGTCAAGWTEVVALSGKTLVGTVAANMDVGTVGGIDAIIPAGINSAPMFTGDVLATHTHAVGTFANTAASAGTPTGVNSAPTFTGSALGTHLHGVGTYDNAAVTGGTPVGTIAWPAGVPVFAGTLSTTVVNHTHGFTDARGLTTGGATTNYSVGVVAQDTSSTATALLTANPGGGAANYTPAGTIAWPAGVPTFTGSVLATHDHMFSGSSEAVAAGTPAGTVAAPVFTGDAMGTHTHTFSGVSAATGGGIPAGTNSAPTFTGTQFDNRSAFVKVIFCSKD